MCPPGIYNYFVWVYLVWSWGVCSWVGLFWRVKMKSSNTSPVERARQTYNPYIPSFPHNLTLPPTPPHLPTPYDHYNRLYKWHGLYSLCRLVVLLQIARLYCIAECNTVQLYNCTFVHPTFGGCAIMLQCVHFWDTYDISEATIYRRFKV